MSERIFQPARLAHARKLRAMRQNELAAKVEVTPAAISQYESGRAKPSSFVIEKLALKLGFAPDWFFRPPATSSEAPAFFRSLRAVSQQERDRAKAYALALGELFTLVEDAVELPACDLPRISTGPEAGRDDIEAAALRVRALWGVPPGPVPNMVRLLEAHGAVVAAVGAFDDRMDAFSLWPGGPRPVVVLCSRSGTAARRRFDAAHELAHLVLHEHPAHEHWQEQQAHAFAASFLMPAEEVGPWLPTRANDLELLQEGSSTWGVSMQALLFRARDLGSLSDGAYQRTMQRISAAGWRREEPVALGPPEAPALLQKALQALVSGGGSVAGLAEQFGVPEGRLRRMLSVPETQGLTAPGDVVPLRAARSA